MVVESDNCPDVGPDTETKTQDDTQTLCTLITLYITQAPVTRLRDTETLLSDPETQQMGDTSTRSASGSGSGPGPSEVNTEIKEWKRCKCILISARGLDV